MIKDAPDVRTTHRSFDASRTTQEPSCGLGEQMAQPQRRRDRRVEVVLCFAVAAVAASCTRTKAPSGPSTGSIAPPANPRTVPRSLTFTCNEEGVHESGRYVQPEADGVHVRLVDERQRVSRIVEGTGPGLYSRSCTQPNWCDMPADASAPVAPTQCVWYLVVDPERFYRAPAQTKCMSATDLPGHGTFALGGGETLDSALRGQLLGLQPADQIRPEGYPKAVPRGIDVVRDGALIATAWYQPIAIGEWREKYLTACDGLGLGWTRR